MRWTIYILEPHADGSEMWKHLCIVFDHEALGLMERILGQTKITFKVDKDGSVPVSRPIYYSGMSND
jgi:hypothetical protein